MSAQFLMHPKRRRLQAFLGWSPEPFNIISLSSSAVSPAAGTKAHNVLSCFFMAGPDIVVIGGSAGALGPLKSILLGLPKELSIAVFVVLHRWPACPGLVVPLLEGSGPRTIRDARDLDKVTAGVVLVAPPDRHLILKSGFVRVARSPRENQWRPAIDILFRSAAVAYGTRVVGVILSGTLDDGTAGMHAIKRCGGTAIVQAPSDAQFPDMPYFAAHNTLVDQVLPHEQIPGAIQRATADARSWFTPVPRDLAAEVQFAEIGCVVGNAPDTQGLPTDFAEARRVDGGGGETVQCGALDSDHLRASLWAAVRQFEQRANLCRALAEDEDARGHRQVAVVYRDRAQESQRHACQLRLHLGEALRAGSGTVGEFARPQCACAPKSCPLGRRHQSFQK